MKFVMKTTDDARYLLELGCKIREMRLSKVGGIKKMTELTGLSATQIIDIELGRINSNILTYSKICKVLSVKLELNDFIHSTSMAIR
jgi:DNA-binding XRE family transcriptional regulator